MGRGLWTRDAGRAGARLASLVATACLLAGCIPEAVPPDLALDVPDAFRAAPAHAHGPNGRADAVWWAKFRSPELSRFMVETIDQNFDIAAAVARVLQADAASQVAGAALLPMLNASDSTTNSKSPTALGGVGSPRTVLVASFTASYELDFWGRNRATLLAAEETATGNRFDKETVTISSLAGTADAYFSVLSARERIAAAQDDLRLSSRILGVIRDRVSQGTASALDLAQQEALVANIRASIPPLRIIADQNIASLAVLLGRAPERVAVVGGSISAIAVPRIDAGLPSEVLLQRPDVQNAEAQLASAHASLFAARAAFFPTITLTAQGGFESLALRTLFSPASTFYSAAISLAQPIFDGGLLQGQFNEAKGRQDELLADYRKAVINAFADVERALVALRDSAQQEELLRQSLAASRKAYDLSETRLREGVIDVVTLLQTQQTLFTTQDNVIQARLARIEGAVSLYQALGGGSDVRIRDGS